MTPEKLDEVIAPPVSVVVDKFVIVPVVIVEIALLPSRTNALFAAAVPFVIPSSFSRSVSSILAEPIINEPEAVTLPVTPTLLPKVPALTFISLAYKSLISRSPFVPLKTSLEFVASGMKENLPELSSNPKKPTLAAEPLCHLNSIPLSLLSSELGVESPPIVKIGSSIVTVVLLTVVVVPLTVRVPVTAKS